MSAVNGFDGFADFDSDPTASIVAEFNRLAIQNNWKKRSSKYKNQRARLAAAEFDAQFGNNFSGLEGWQALCTAVGITNIPSSITQCKKLLRKVHVNIFDLIDAARSGKATRTFPDNQQLADYTQKNDKVFGKVEAKSNKLLKFMLRQIF